MCRAIISPSSLSDLKNRSENLTGRSQISSILKGNSASIARESGGIWIVQADLQPISFKSDRLLDVWEAPRLLNKQRRPYSGPSLHFSDINGLRRSIGHRAKSQAEFSRQYQPNHRQHRC